MTQPLSRQLLPRPKTWPDRIVQFGGGNFLRGFVDWVIDILNEETDFAAGIVLVKATPGAYDALDRQDRLFTTWLCRPHALPYCWSVFSLIPTGFDVQLWTAFASVY